MKDLGLLVEKTTAGQDIIKKRLERGDIIVDGLIRRKGR